MPYRVYDENNRLVGYIEDDSQIDQWLESLPEDYYTFPVGAFSADVEKFMLRLNSRAATGTSFFDLLQTKYGRVPSQINPFSEIKELLFGQNAFFIKVRREFTNMTILGQLLTVLRNTLSAGSAFFVLLEPESVQEYVSPAIAESFQLFQVPESAAATSVEGVSESWIASTVV